MYRHIRYIKHASSTYRWYILAPKHYTARNMHMHRMCISVLCLSEAYTKSIPCHMPSWSVRGHDSWQQGSLCLQRCVPSRGLHHVRGCKFVEVCLVFSFVPIKSHELHTVKIEYGSERSLSISATISAISSSLSKTLYVMPSSSPAKPWVSTWINAAIHPKSEWKTHTCFLSGQWQILWWLIEAGILIDHAVHAWFVESALVCIRYLQIRHRLWNTSIA